MILISCTNETMICYCVLWNCSLVGVFSCAVDANLVPENFERALQMRMPDQKAAKEEDTDSCRSLLKALGIKKSSSKKQSASTKNVTRKKDDVRQTDTGCERYFISGEPAEE